MKTIILISSCKDMIDKLPLGDKKKVALIPNAKDMNAASEYKLFLERHGLNVTIVDLDKFKGESLYKQLLKFEIIYVKGGNTFLLLQKMRESGFDKLLNKLLKKGIIYVGQSAGACVMGTSLEPFTEWDDLTCVKIKNFNGLCYIDFVFIPHYRNPEYSAIIKRIEKEYSKKFKLKKFTDVQGVVIENDIVREI